MPNFYIQRNAEEYKALMKRLGRKTKSSVTVKKLKNGRRLTIYTVTEMK